MYLWGINCMSNIGNSFSPPENTSRFGLSKNSNMNTPPKMRFSEPIGSPDPSALPAGKAYKEGAKILLPTKAFDVYHMNALYADPHNINGDVKEINGNLYAKGENPIIEYVPKEQIIQPNNHISGAVKNAQADKRLEDLKPHNDMMGDMSLTKIMPNILLGSIAGAIAGAVLHSPLLMLGSLGVGGATLHLVNEQSKKSSQIETDDFKKKIASLV